MALLNQKTRKTTLYKKMKFFIKDFFSFLRIWSHLLKKSLMENFIFCAVKERFWVRFYYQTRIKFLTIFHTKDFVKKKKIL